MKYDSDNVGLIAGDEQIWAGMGIHVSEDDRRRLNDLGWFLDESSWSHYAM